MFRSRLYSRLRSWWARLRAPLISYGLLGHYTLIFTDAQTGQELRRSEYWNLTPTVGKVALAKQLAGTNTTEVQVTYMGVGTGSTAPVVGATTLSTELARVAVSSSSVAGAVATLQAFFNSATGNGTLTNMGSFGDGDSSTATASADTGILYSLVSITETKTSSETMTLQVQFTIT